uniref:ABC transporter domain-containing protein n=1 Tax=Spongospora subterranea TaxID=70186 RepID=A0A0H5QSD5_9EUKA|eukprot:CRZ04938.1 hypothetical protein [Spongospora subterranea]
MISPHVQVPIESDLRQPDDPFSNARGQNFLTQVKALTKKSLIIQRRQYRTNVCQIIFPLLVLFMLFGLQQFVNSVIKDQYGEFSPENFHPSATPLNLAFYDKKASECASQPAARPVVDASSGRLLITSNGLAEVGNGTGQVLSKLLLPPLSNGVNGIYALGLYRHFDRQGSPDDICAKKPRIFTQLTPVFMDNDISADDRLFHGWGNPADQFTGGASFTALNSAQGIAKYNVYDNATFTQHQDLPALLTLMSSTVYRHLVQPASAAKAQYQISMTGTKNFPQPKTAISFDLISLVGPQLYIYVIALLFPVFLGNMVQEKESKLLEIMSMMGLRRNVYFLVTYAFNFTLYFIAMTCLVIVAIILNFRFFTANAFGIYFILLFLWGNVICSAAALCAQFFTKSRTATVVGYLLVFGGGLFAAAVNNFIEGDNHGALANIFQLFPSFALYHGLMELSKGVAGGSAGLSFSDLSDDDVGMQSAYLYLLFEWIFFLIMYFYVTECREHGLLACFNPRSRTTHLQQPPPVPDLDEGEDIKLQRSLAHDEKSKSAVRVKNMRKVYAMGNQSDDRVAVHGLSMVVEFGECRGFIGSNGAGKSTTLSMLCGHVKPTSGTASIFGKDIVDDVHQIHSILGVCPQENVLWGDMTGGEHLVFYGMLKGLSGAELESAVVSGLHNVELLNVRNKRSAEYSGGMKRRLCVAVSLIGSPKVVLLDEPTTGLDPAARRNLWDVINKAKKKCAMLMTTHSMEEAENLCDSIAIFEAGKLQCIGSSSALKNRFESGYKITIACLNSKHDEAIVQLVKKLSDKAVVLNSLAGTLNFEVPISETKLSTVFREIDGASEQLGIIDWGICNTTLEEVFVRIATGLND